MRIAGIAKGSGMIAPDMGTMLVYVFTDAARGAGLAAGGRLGRDRADLQPHHRGQRHLHLGHAADGRDRRLGRGRRRAQAAFAEAVERVFLDLALQVVRDGEGATKLVEVRVTGAASDADAKTVALAIANSPLVKTAIAGEDANWGRIVMAVGKSRGRGRPRPAVDPLRRHRGGAATAPGAPDYSEEAASAYMKGRELVLGVDLGLGEGAATVWTCDLTHGYIDINADYRS